MQNVQEASASPAEAQWNGLSDTEKARFVDELCALGTGFDTPLFAVIDNIEKVLRERNALPAEALQMPHEREAFEIWWTGKGNVHSLHGDYISDDRWFYLDGEVDDAWKAWEGRAALCQCLAIKGGAA